MACSSVDSSSEGERKLDEGRGEGKSPEVVFISPENWNQQSPCEQAKESTELEASIITAHFTSTELEASIITAHFTSTELEASIITAHFRAQKCMSCWSCLCSLCR